jgi:hypothetical protein
VTPPQSIVLVCHGLRSIKLKQVKRKGYGACSPAADTCILSPPAAGSSWMDWSHTWGTEMRLKKVLKKLNLEYPRDSDD